MQRAARLIVGSCSLATTSPWEFAGTDWLALLDEVVLAEAFRVAPDRSRGEARHVCKCRGAAAVLRTIYR